MKKKWNTPFVFPLEDGGAGSDTGVGSGLGTPDLDDIPWDFLDWYANGGDELDLDGDEEKGSWEDYVIWMTDHGYPVDESQKP